MKNILFIFPLLTSFLVSSQENNLIKTLHEDGFENLQSFTSAETLYLSYENNRYRFQGRGLAEVLKIASKEVSGLVKDLVVLIKYKDIPVTVVKTDLETLKTYVSGAVSYETWASQASFSLSTDKVYAKFEGQETVNSSFYKADIPVGVHLDYALGDFYNAIKVDLNIAPEFKTVLGKGLTTSFEYHYEIENDLNKFNFNAPNIARISQDIRLDGNKFFNFNLGYFSNQRFGIHMRYLSYLLEEKLSFSASFGLTQYAYLDENIEIMFSNFERFVYKAGLTYRHNPIDTDFSVEYGKFLDFDLGYKVGVQRQFNEVFIGFYFLKTNAGENLGFNFQVPIVGNKYLKPNRLRVRQADAFSLLYRYTSFNGAGLEYSTGENFQANLKEFYPQVLKKSLKKILAQKS